MWPISPLAPWPPGSTTPSIAYPAAIPVPMATKSIRRVDRPAPRRASARAAARTSWPRTVGRPSFSLTRSRSGTSRSPRLAEKTATPLDSSITPGAARPTAIGCVPWVLAVVASSDAISRIVATTASGPRSAPVGNHAVWQISPAGSARAHLIPVPPMSMATATGSLIRAPDSTLAGCFAHHCARALSAAQRGEVGVDRYARWNALLELLTETVLMSCEDAADRLDVSQATIRRDFDQLAQQQMITRTRGGAVVNGVSYDLPLRYKSAKHASEKQRIGAAAATLVAPAMVVGLTGGTTTTEVARALAARQDLSGVGADGPQLTIVTNALNIANELVVRSRMKIVVTGGVIRPQSYELVGPLATGILRELTLDMAFLGVDAFDATLGAASHHEGEAAMNSLLASRARQIVVIADSSKLGRHAFARVCPPEKVHTLVTDAHAADREVTAFLAAGIEVLCV